MRNSLNIFSHSFKFNADLYLIYYLNNKNVCYFIIKKIQVLTY